jgi:hypothetical protein
MKWAVNEARMDEKRDTARFLVRNSEEKNDLENLSMYHRIIKAVIDWAGQLNYIVQKVWKALHFIMRILKKGNSNMKISAFTLLVGPILERGAAC